MATASTSISTNGGAAEIPFWIHDRPKWVSGISRHTTCQDVLHALVKAERKANPDQKSTNKSEKSEDVTCRKISRQLALVEQWRGVERPLSGSSRILKLWNAWGEERNQVKFVIKRISSSSSASSLVAPPVTSITSSQVPAVPGRLPNGLGSTLPTRSRKPRRRNSRASACSSARGSVVKNQSGEDDLYKRSETVHPNALLKKSKSSSSGLIHDDIERLMRIILTQGETIHAQLRRLREREGQIETIEQQVHDSRTKTAGKDYLLNAYLDTLSASSTDDERGAVPKHKYPKSPSKQDPSCLSEMVQNLNKICTLNERLTRTEEKINDLHNQLGTPPVSSADEEDSVSARRELNELVTLNDKYGQEIDYNRHLISSMRLAFDERRALMAKLEEDVCSVESEGQQLQQELQSIQESRQKQTLELLQQMDRVQRLEEVEPELDTEETDEDEMPILFADAAFLNSAAETPTILPDQQIGHQNHTNLLPANGHYQITNEQLYDTTVTSAMMGDDPRTLYNELQRRLHIKTSGLPDLPSSLPSGCLVDPNNRISATGSPGSASSSGNSSGSGGSYEKSVRFSDREMVMATPDLPDLPDDLPSDSSNGALVKSQASGSRHKSILKTAEPHGDTDSNSDTGLSSLHSSSDEGTYVLDTLV